MTNNKNINHPNISTISIDGNTYIQKTISIFIENDHGRIVLNSEIIEVYLSIYLSHKNLNNCYKYSISSDIKSINLISHKYEKIVDLIKCSSFQIKIKWIIDICRALKFLHSKGILHGDIKPDNILVDDDNNCKLSDFGLSTVVDNQFINIFSKLYTKKYRPPEAEYSRYYLSSDIWALAITIKDILRDELRSDVFSNNFILINKSLKKIIKKMLSFNPEDRPSINKIYKYFNTLYMKNLSDNYIHIDNRIKKQKLEYKTLISCSHENIIYNSINKKNQQLLNKDDMENIYHFLIINNFEIIDTI